MKIIFCRGGTKKHTPIVLNQGWEYGLRSDATCYHSDVSFLDIHYQKGKSEWLSHLERALELRPHLTMIPDFETQYTLDDLMPIHNKLSNAGLQTMWTPKQHNIMHSIPTDAIIGVSVPTRHGAFLPNPNELVGRKLHMLGGDPDAIRYLIDKVYFRSEIFSIDTSYFVAKAFNGQYWSPTIGKWIQKRNQEFSNEDLIILSAVGIKEYLLADTVPVFNMKRAPIKRIWNNINNIASNQMQLAM